MKKTVLKIFSLCLCLILALGVLSACGKKNETFVIGCTGPLTGDAASYGNSVQKGAQLAIKEINANGGLNGVNFSFEMVDDEASGDKVTAAYNTLISKGMIVAIGSVTSGSCLTFASQSKEDNLFFITPSASADDAIANTNGYRICFGDPDQGMYAAKALVASYQKIGVIYNIDDAYSTGLLKGFEDEMSAQSKTNYVKKSFSDNTKTTFATQITELKSAGCDVIFLPIYYQEASLIIAEAGKQNFDVDFFGCDGMDGIVKHVAENASLSEQIKGLKYLAPIDVNSTDEKVKGFVDAYKAEYNGEVPDQFAADAYDAVYVIYEAMKKANIDDPNMDPSDLCNKLTAILQGDFTFVGVTGTMTWNETGAAVKKPVTITID